MNDTPDVDLAESPNPSKQPAASRELSSHGGCTRILAMANQKGGVGKTTSAINLATAMAACRQRVLLIDIDPQGNASTGLAVPRDARAKGSYQVLTGELPLAQAIQPTLVPGMDICPAGEELLGAEIELVDLGGREYRLRQAIRALTDSAGGPGGAGKPYDFIIIDCPPGLGLLTLNALVAADSLMVPLQTEFYALEGLSHLLKTLERVQRGLNPALKLQGIVLTMVDRRNNLSQMVEADVREHLGDKVYKTTVPRNVRVSEAQSYGQPVLLYDLRCPGAKAYMSLAREVLEQEGLLAPATPAAAAPAESAA